MEELPSLKFPPKTSEAINSSSLPVYEGFSRKTSFPEPAEKKEKAAKKAGAGRRKGKRQMSDDGKLAIRAGVMLRNWKASHPDAGEEEVAKQRDKFVQQLRKAG